MYGTHETIQKTAELIEGRFKVDGYEPAVKEWAADELAEVQEDLDLVIRGDEGYEDFLLTFIGRERERYLSRGDPDRPYDEPRERPLCTCNDIGCALKQGELPTEIRHSDGLQAGIREFKRGHSGDPIVLDHAGEPPGARQVWSKKRQRVWRVLRRVKTYLQKSQSEPPTEDELGDGLEAVP